MEKAKADAVNLETLTAQAVTILLLLLGYFVIHRRDLHEAIARAVATSGGAVFFAGCTVTIALISLVRWDPGSVMDWWMD